MRKPGIQQESAILSAKSLTQDTKDVVGHWGGLGKEEPSTWELEVRTEKTGFGEAAE